MDEELSQLLQAIQDSPKYRHIHPGLVERIGAEELKKGRKHKDAIKATKNKLHQVGGAYLGQKQVYDKWFAELKASSNNPEQLKASCRKIMQRHTSTKERLPILEGFYDRIFTELPEIHSVLDVACGLNPLTIPWMPLAKGAKYFACDIYRDMSTFIDDVIPLLGLKGKAELCDIITAPPTQQVDLALILKTIPCLEQVDKHAGKRLLDTINAKYLVVSFPAKSLGGKEKGRVENYGERFGVLVEGRGWEVEKFEFEMELVFRVIK